jgi:hypothetical protein
MFLSFANLKIPFILFGCKRPISSIMQCSLKSLNFLEALSLNTFKSKILIIAFTRTSVPSLPTLDTDFINFAIDLKEFIEEDKINQFEKRVNERFSHIIQQIGNETTDLISKEAEIEKIIKKINNDFISKNFVEAIKEMEMRTQKSSNPVVLEQLFSLILFKKSFWIDEKVSDVLN